MKAKEMTNLYWFCQSVEFGGFAPTSLKTNVSAPTLSRAVSQLEETLGEKLVHRNAKNFQLTIAGEEYYQRFAPLFLQVNDQWQQMSNNQATLTGDIRVSCPEPFADYFLQELSMEFIKKHPGVNIDIRFASDTERFFVDQIDIAVVTTPTETSNLIQRQLFDVELALAASPAYLEKFGMPEKAEDLLNHQLLAGNTLPYWEFKTPTGNIRIPLKAKYAINSLKLCMKAACSDAGVCILPKETLKVLASEGVLQEVLPNIHCPSGKAYLVWADRKLIPTRVATFKDIIFERLKKPNEFMKAMAKKQFIST